ncbi:hypothetical protein QQZ08_008710 [Neonectria magnoliae]|uniref:Adhesin domain-containing protein n=1 Tax=Neonectria magnoliae TaxID=2732573 RepID=A0ABR1HTC5_9HYPO
MPSPYSDNLYSAADPSDDEADALSPTDGYFHASSPDPASSSSHSHGPYHRSAASVPRVPNVFVEDPTWAGPGSKAREAEAERALLNSSSTAAEEPAWSSTGGSAGYQASTSPTGHHHRRSVEEEHSPYSSFGHHVASTYTGHQASGVATTLLPHHSDAPPAYTPSPTSPPTTGYQTFAPSNSTMGLPEEQQRLIPRGPESMGDQPTAPSPSRWQRFKNFVPSFVTSFDLRKKLRTALGVLVVFSVIIILFSSFTPRREHNHPDIVDNTPVKKPDMDHTDLIWNPSGGCLNRNLKRFRSTLIVEMRYARNLTIVQTMEKEDNDISGWTPRVSGDVVLRPTEKGSPGTIELEVIYNDDKLDWRIDYDKTTQIYKIITPRKVKWNSGSDGPCIQIRATVWVPRESILNSFKIDTLHLDVAIREGLILGVTNPTVIHTKIGDIKSPALKDDKTPNGKDAVVPYTLAAREIHISTTTGDVNGWYPLYDVLDIRTKSGDVSARVGPKPANPEGVRPAVLRVHSVSGEIAVQEPFDRAASAARPDKKFPPRDYIVDMATASGDISADVAVSSHAEFSSQSGDLKLRLWPVLDSGLLKRGGGPETPVLKTDTKSGYTNVALLEPLWTSLATIGESIPPKTGNDDGEPYIILPPEMRSTNDVFVVNDTPALSCLASKHSSISGNIKLEYPSSWEGKLLAATISGSQAVRGDGLEVDRESGGPWSKRTRGRKGTGHSQLDIDSMSGDEDVLIGREFGSKAR